MNKKNIESGSINFSGFEVEVIYCDFLKKSTFNFNFLKFFQSEHHGFLRIQEIKLLQNKQN